jgi:hypothetical protein
MQKTTTTNNNSPQGWHFAIIYAGFLLFIALLFSVLQSCNTTKRAYKAIEKHEPKSPKDTARLANRAKATFPLPQPVVKPGKTQVRTIVRTDEGKVRGLQGEINRLLDSLAKGCPNINIDSIRLHIAKQIKDSCKPKEVTNEVVRVDTLELPSLAQEAENVLLKQKLSQTETEKIKVETQNKQLKENWNDLSSVLGRAFGLLLRKPLFWLIILAALALVAHRLKLIRIPLLP